MTARLAERVHPVQAGLLVGGLRYLHDMDCAMTGSAGAAVLE